MYIRVAPYVSKPLCPKKGRSCHFPKCRSPQSQGGCNEQPSHQSTCATAKILLGAFLGQQIDWKHPSSTGPPITNAGLYPSSQATTSATSGISRFTFLPPWMHNLSWSCAVIEEACKAHHPTGSERQENACGSPSNEKSKVNRCQASSRVTDYERQHK